MSRHGPRGRGRSGALMSKHETRPPVLPGSASEIPSLAHAGAAQTNSSCRSVLGEIGFIGVGNMGRPMAANLAAAGRRVIAYVRRSDQFGELEALGFNATTDVGNLLDCDVVITMLPDDEAARGVVFGTSDDNLDGLAAGLMPGAIHLSMSTISTAAASVMASEHARHGQGYVAAPVFGNPDAAKARQLFIVAAGASADIERCQPIFDSLGQRTSTVGSDP